MLGYQITGNNLANITAVRSQIGFCPQHDIIYEGKTKRKKER